MSFLTGSRGKWSQKSLLGPEQQQTYTNLLQSAQRPGAGGAFGTAADYYRSLLSNDNETYNQLIAPELRRFRERTIPELSEQFAGMGSGGLSSSGFRNAAVSAGTDLGERLGAIRAQLRQQGAQGLMDIGNLGLQRYNENVYTAGTPGFLQNLGSGIGQGLGMAGGAALTSFLGPAGGALAGAAGSLINRAGERSTQGLYQRKPDLPGYQPTNYQPSWMR